MQQYLDKAEVLIEALPYIQRFNRKIIVVKYGGSAMLDEELKKRVIQDVVLLKLTGFKPIIVHGGGKEISKWINKVGMEPKFVNGLRVTDEATMEIAEMVLNKVNKSLVQMVNELGIKAVGISGKDGMLPREIRSLMPDKGELLLLTAESGSLSSLFNLKAEICQLASQFLIIPPDVFPLIPNFFCLLWIFSIPADEECGNAKKRADKFVERLKNMYHLPFRGTSSSMPAPEQLLPTVQAMELSLSDTPPEPSENKQEIKNLDSANGKVRFVCEYISTHYQENLSLEALAEISYLHPDYLSRIFKKETGMNLNRYIKTFRLNQACRQLETTQQKITAISASVGYQNCAYFIRSFTEHFGISPEKYRQQHNQFSGGKSL